MLTANGKESEQFPFFFLFGNFIRLSTFELRLNWNAFKLLISWMLLVLVTPMLLQISTTTSFASPKMCSQCMKTNTNIIMDYFSFCILNSEFGNFNVDANIVRAFKNVFQFKNASAPELFPRISFAKKRQIKYFHLIQNFEAVFLGAHVLVCALESVSDEFEIRIIQFIIWTIFQGIHLLNQIFRIKDK